MSNILTSTISGSDCLSVSFSTINTNFNNLDTTICTASTNFINLNITPTKGDSGTNVYGVPGLITAYAGYHIPSNWVACDGTELDIASNTSLYNVIGNTFGIASTNLNFVLPNLQSTGTTPTIPEGDTNISYGAYNTSTIGPTAQLTISSNTPDYFGTTTPWPSGYYRVRYETGGYNLGTTSNWTGYIGYSCNLVYSNSNVPASGVYIGTYNKDITQSYTQLISSGQNYFGPNQPYYYDFYHTGGPIYIYLYDDKYTDNTIGNADGTNTGTPVYSLYSVVSTLAVNYIISTSN